MRGLMILAVFGLLMSHGALAADTDPRVQASRAAVKAFFGDLKGELVKQKVEAAIAEGLGVIVCIGETLEQREKGRTLAVNRKQLHGSLPDGANAKNTVIAYEPVWAIGTGKVATPAQAQEVHALIRKELAKALGEAEANKVRILYGGSMKPDNAAELLALPDVDGGLIGGASLKVEDFWAIAKAVS